MTRLIKRYGSRKLYDTTDSRYILLEDIAEFVRNGQEIKVVDNKTQEDVTSQTLTQVISEVGRKKADFLSSELLHDLIRAGESAVTSRVRQLQTGMESFMKKSIDRIVPLKTVRDEMALLRNRLEELEVAVNRAEANTSAVVEAEPVVEQIAVETPVIEKKKVTKTAAPASADSAAPKAKARKSAKVKTDSE